MESFKNFQNIKAEKTKAMGKCHMMQKVTAFFKLIELFIFLILLARFTTLFPVSFNLSGEHVKEFFVKLLSPRFVFIVGNLIVFTLFWKSGKLSNQDCSSNNNNNNGKLDFYDQYVKSCTINKKDEFEGKHSMKKHINEQLSSHEVVCRDIVMVEKKMERSQSDRLRNTHEAKIGNGLRRSKTEKCLKMKNNNEVVAVHEMSNEDFRLRVESFIARQQRFLREDEKEE